MSILTILLYNFNKTLALIVSYIDKYNGTITTNEYVELQQELMKITPKSNYASIRKAINQFLKLGFINNGMRSYHAKTKLFLEETNKKKKKRIYLEILYDNSSFSCSFSHEADQKEINFLVKTLEHCGEITKSNLYGLMFIDIQQYSKGYVNEDELKIITNQAIANKVIERKYNQLSYLFNLCKNVLSGIYVNAEGCLTLDRDEQVNDFLIKKSRDPYKQRLYKLDLIQESLDKNNKIACFVENIHYPVLIASHIKPYALCNESEQFDANNGFLLSKNFDSLFDQGWISFLNNGKIIYSKFLDDDLKNLLDQYYLDVKFLQSEKRLEYLKFHRENVFDINKKLKDS